MRRTRLIPLLAAWAVFAAPVAAEEIVHFTNGTAMPVVSHSISDGMVHVDLGDNGFIAFPEYVVDHIETAGKHVALKPSYVVPGAGNSRNAIMATRNRRVPTPEGSYPVRSYKELRTTTGRQESLGSAVKTDAQTGLAYIQPMGNSPAPNKRAMRVNGNSSILSQSFASQRTLGQYMGTSRIGNKHVIGRAMGPSRGGSSETLVGIEMNGSPHSSGSQRLGRLTVPADSGKGNGNN